MRLLLAFIIFLDGFLSAALGFSFLLLLRGENAHPVVKKVINYFLTWDERKFRVGASLQALAGLLMMINMKRE